VVQAFILVWAAACVATACGGRVDGPDTGGSADGGGNPNDPDAHQPVHGSDGGSHGGPADASIALCPFDPPIPGHPCVNEGQGCDYIDFSGCTRYRCTSGAWDEGAQDAGCAH
jgi:hypothetical protein